MLQLVCPVSHAPLVSSAFIESCCWYAGIQYHLQLLAELLGCACDDISGVGLYAGLLNCFLVDCSTPDWHSLTPAIQPVHLPPAAAQAGSCCTPHQHPLPARAETPDTAKLLQRALASSSGSALLNSCSQEPSNAHPVRSVPAGFTGLNEGGTAATAASSVAMQTSLSGSAPVERSEQQHGDAGSAAVSSSSSGTALVSSCLPGAMPDNRRSAADGSTSLSSASALPQSSQTGPGAASALLINQEAVSQKQVWAIDQSAEQSASHRQQLAGTDQQQQQQQVKLSSASAGQQYGPEKQAKHTGQPRRGLETEVQVNEGVQVAAYKLPSVAKQAAGHHTGPLQQEGSGLTGAGLAASIADSAGHVTSQVQLHLACSRLMFLRLYIRKDSRPDCA